jgi:hypothetical protein
MNKHEQIDRLQFIIERIDAHLAEQHIPNNFRELFGHTEPNESESDRAERVRRAKPMTDKVVANIMREFSEIMDIITNNPAIIPKGESIMNRSEKPNSCELEYSAGPNGIISIPYGLTDSEEKSYIEMQKQIMQDAFEILWDKFMEKFKQTESTQYELPDFVPDWKDAPEDANCLAMDKDGQWWWYGNKAVISSMSFIGDWINSYPGQCTNATRLHPDYWKNSLQERPAQTEPDYTHLLPEGYEFCEEGEHTAWVKVEMNHDSINYSEVGCVYKESPYSEWKPYYRPIRPIAYHISVHESVTAEPDPYTMEKHGDGWAIYKGRDLMHHGANLGQIHDEKLAQYIGGLLKGFKDDEPDPYQVDWSNAPEWADVHCFDIDRRGYWYGHRYNVLYSDWETMTIGSNFNLPEGPGIERKFSKTINPKLK